jgi:hypothetical protein
MDEMNITSAKYMAHPKTGENDAIKATIDGMGYTVPLAVGNSHYDEIMRRVAAGTLTIADAD